MLFKQKNSERTLKLSNDHYTSSIMLSVHNQTLEIISKHNEKNEEYWGSFALADLDRQAQCILQSVQGLYNYIFENTQEVEIDKSLVTINLNFLKNQKKIKLRLNPMQMFSEQQLEKNRKKIIKLEHQIQRLKSQFKGALKLTLKLSPETVNLNHYQVVNFSQIHPFRKGKNLSLLIKHEQNLLPEKGIWHFLIHIDLITGSLIEKNSQKQDNSSIGLIGIRNNTGQESILKMRAYLERQEEEEKVQSIWVNQKDLLKVVIDMESLQIWISNCFREGKAITSWSNFKNCSKLWLTLSLSNIDISTDLFRQPPIYASSENSPQSAGMNAE